MKKALLIASVLFIAVITTACINNMAVQELNNKAAEYMAKGDYESAINRLEASIDLDSTVYETYYNLGIAATSAEKYDLAIQSFEKGLKINSDSSNLYYSLAVAQYEFANSILEKDNEKELNKQDISKADREFAYSKLVSALSNYKKYIELSPDANDKEDVEDIIENINEILEKNASNDKEI